MQTIRAISQEIRRTGQLTSEQVFQINTLLRRQQTEADLQALDELMDALIQGQIESSSTANQLLAAS